LRFLAPQIINVKGFQLNFNKKNEEIAEGISTFQDAVKLPRSVGLVSHLGAAKLAAVFILIPLREYQEQEFSDRYRTPTLGAVKFGGLQVLKIPFRLAGLRSGRNILEWIFLHGHTPCI
jgi:hypothetical protein